MFIRINSKEQEQLVLDNVNLVYHLVNRFGKTRFDNDYDDCVSVGIIGLIKAAATFDHTKKIKFSTYASKCINNELYNHFRDEKSFMYNISLDATLYYDNNGQELTLYDQIANSDKDFTKTIADYELFTEYIDIILNLFESKERLIMLYIVAGITQNVIAKTFNISRSWVAIIKKKAIKKIRLYLTTGKSFNKVFSMAIVDDFYQITFDSNNVENFDKILETFLQKNSTDNLLNLQIYYNNHRTIIQVPAHPEYFFLIAKILQEIDNTCI